MKAKDYMDKNRIEFEAAFPALDLTWNASILSYANIGTDLRWAGWKASRAGLAAPVEGQSGLEKLVRYHHNGYSKDMHEDPCGEFYKVEGVQAIFATLTAPVAATEQATDDTPEVPEGAMHNGEVFANMLENIYDFACEAGPLSNCLEWTELRRCMAAMREYISSTPLATPADAGAGEGLTIKTWRERLTAGYEECDEREARDAEVVELREVLARLSTSPAPVTAEPVAAQFKMPGETWEECSVDEEEVMLKHGYKFRYLYSAPAATAQARLVDPDECAANMNGHRFGAHGRHGEAQCEWCGAAPVIAAPTAPTFWNSQRKMIERAIIGLRDGWATRKDADNALAILAAAPTAPQSQQEGAGEVDEVMQAIKDLHTAKRELDIEQSRAAGSHKHIDSAHRYQGAIAKLIDAALSASTPAVPKGEMK